MTPFEAELEALINRHHLENESNTPDFILALYLSLCLDAYNKSMKARATWYGRMDVPAVYPKKESMDKYEAVHCLVCKVKIGILPNDELREEIRQKYRDALRITHAGVCKVEQKNEDDLSVLGVDGFPFTEEPIEPFDDHSEFY